MVLIINTYISVNVEKDISILFLILIGPLGTMSVLFSKQIGPLWHIEYCSERKIMVLFTIIKNDFFVVIVFGRDE